MAASVRAPLHGTYGQRVSEVCDEVNAADRALARDLVALDGRLRRARSTGLQRDALLDGTHHELSRTIHALTTLDALDPPASLSSAHRSTTAAWHRNVGRIRAYAARLDQASDRPQLRAAIRGLARARPRIERDNVRITTGLLRLGEPGCQIDGAAPSKTITLPTLADRDGADSGRVRGSGSTASRDALPSAAGTPSTRRRSPAGGRDGGETRGDSGPRRNSDNGARGDGATPGASPARDAPPLASPPSEAGPRAAAPAPAAPAASAKPPPPAVPTGPAADTGGPAVNTPSHTTNPGEDPPNGPR